MAAVLQCYIPCPLHCFLIPTSQFICCRPRRGQAAKAKSAREASKPSPLFGAKGAKSACQRKKQASLPSPPASRSPFPFPSMPIHAHYKPLGEPQLPANTPFHFMDGRGRGRGHDQSINQSISQSTSCYCFGFPLEQQCFLWSHAILVVSNAIVFPTSRPRELALKERPASPRLPIKL